MMNQKSKELNRVVFASLVLGLLFIFSACNKQDEPTTLRMAMLPIMDTLPAHVAEAQGYFEEENLKVEFLSVGSAPDRDQLIKSGQADGMVNELLSTMFYNSDSAEVVTVRFARKATPDYPHFFVLASADSNISSPLELKGAEIGISEGTIIEYSTNRLLEAAGLERI